MAAVESSGQGQASFGELLRRYRAAAGLTQEALAEQAHLSARGISDLERGVRRVPRPDTLLLLVQALGLAAPARVELEAAARRPESTAPTVAVTQPPFVGRARELALLERYLGGEGPPLLLLSGEPGIGKSRLLRAAMAHAAGYGLQVLEGGCQRRGGQEPYAPVLEALQQHIQGRSAAQLRLELQGCAWLVRLLPELADGPIPPLPNWTPTVEQERRLMCEAVVRFLANVAGPAGTLLVLDDLQWAGPDAVDLLARLARVAGAMPLRVLSAYRQSEVRPHEPLNEMLADLAHAGLATHRMITPLTPHESAQLLDCYLEGLEGVAVQREQLLARAGGVPFFVVSCAQALQPGTWEGDRQDAVPWSVAQSVRHRLAALPAATREVLQVAAVIGRLVPHELLSAVAVAAADVPEALAAACAACLLEEVPAQHAYQFTHDVIREVVEDDIGLAQRTLLHRRIAEALESTGREPVAEEVAYHYAQTQVHGRAAHWLERAGDRAAAVFSTMIALGHYRAARERLVAAGGDGPQLAGLDEKVGVVLTTLGQYDAALVTLDGAAVTYRSAHDLERLRRTLAQISEVYQEIGAQQAGLARLLPLLDLIEAQEATPGLAAIYAALADLFGNSPEASAEEYSKKLETAMRAEDLSRAVGDWRLLAAVLERRGTALMYLDRLAEAEQVLLDASRVAEAAGEIKSLGWALEDLGCIHLSRGALDTARVYFVRALEVAERRGNPFQVGSILVHQGIAAFHQEGDWERARALLQKAMAVSSQAPSHTWSVVPRFYLGRLCLAQGDREAGIRYLGEGIVLARIERKRWAQRWAAGLLAERELLEGHAEAALARLTPLIDGPAATAGWPAQVLPEGGGAYVLPILALAYLDLGDMAQAAELASQAVMRLQDHSDHRLALADALRVQALVLLRQGHCEQARCVLDQALLLARSLPYPYGEARLQHVYGQLHAQQDQPGSAREHLEAALAFFRRLGARPDIERTEQLLATLG